MDGWKGGWWEYRNSGPNRAGQASHFNTWIGSSFKTTSSSIFCLWRIFPTGQPELVFFVGFVLLLLIADAFVQSTSTENFILFFTEEQRRNLFHLEIFWHIKIYKDCIIYSVVFSICCVQ
jgi:hypothetical protein